MALKALSKAESIVNSINAFTERKPGEMELHRLRRDIESVKNNNIYEYHMLKGMYYALIRDYQNAVDSYERSLAGGDCIYYQNYAYALVKFDDYKSSLALQIKALQLNPGSAKLFDDVCSVMIHAADFSRLEEVKDLYSRANPEVKLESSVFYIEVLSMLSAMTLLGLSTEDFQDAKGIVDTVLAEEEITYNWFNVAVNRMDEDQYLSFRLVGVDLNSEQVSNANCSIADALADSEIPSWDRMVFVLTTSSGAGKSALR